MRLRKQMQETAPVCPTCERPMRWLGTNSREHRYACSSVTRQWGKGGGKRMYAGCGRELTVPIVAAPVKYLPEPARVEPMPHGVIPTLEEVGRPLGITAGFHTGPGPHFPQHDTRRIYAGTQPARGPQAVTEEPKP